MSYFYGTVQGNRGKSSRRGSKASGIIATANSWTIGGEVVVNYNENLKTDVVTFYISKGSGTITKSFVSFAIIDGKQTILNTTYPELFI